jgi:hypothetical protein
VLFRLIPTLELLHDLDFAVIVAMVAVRMVQVTTDEVVGMVAVRNRLMATIGAVFVVAGMLAAVVIRSAASGIFAVHGDRMFLDSGAGRMVQMPIVQIVNVTIVLNARVPAAFLVLMLVVGVVAHVHFLLEWMKGYPLNRNAQFSKFKESSKKKSLTRDRVRIT